jgi:hypothetical protein
MFTFQSAHIVAVNEVCVGDTDYSVTVIDVYASHITDCVIGTDAIISGMGDIVTETVFSFHFEAFISDS